MDSTEINKIAAAVLCAGLALGAADLVGGALVQTAPPAIPAIPIPGMEPAAPVPAILALLAHASAEKGQAIAGAQCAACHSFDKDGPTLVGPALWNVAGSAIASVPGYDYSDALKQQGGRWTPQRLDAWLTRPQGFAPGTRMGFAGLKQDGDRADVIAYLLTLTDAPHGAAPASAAGAAQAGGSTARGDAAAAAPEAARSGPPNPTATPSPAAVPGPDGGFARQVDAADIKAGAALADAQCSACHSFDKGGSAMVGPGLYGVFGRPIGKGAADFTYSAALSSKPGTWSLASLDGWLQSPRLFAPGTKMAFPGIADDGQRAQVVAYLRSLAETK